MATAVITGSASGIGAAIQQRLEADGDRVIGIDLRGAAIDADLSTPEGRKTAIEGALEHSGGAIDRLVACAGLGPTVEDLRLVASVNYFGAVELLDGLRDAMVGREGAAAVAISSNSARFGPFDDHPYVAACLAHDEALARELVAKENGFVAYGGSKHALCRAVRRRAKPWGEAGVHLNGVCPGATDTPLLRGAIEHPVWGPGVASLDIPLGRRAEPWEIASVIAFLLGPDAGYVHGSVVYVDGGNDAAIRPDRF